MKIAMTNVHLPNENQGGVAHQVHYLANALVARGHEVTVFTFSPPYEECRYQVHQFHASPRWKPFYAFLIAWHLRRTDFSGFDVIHLHGDNFLLWRRHPQLRTFHGAAIDEMMNARTWKYRAFLATIAVLEQVGARVADISVGVSEATRRRFPRISRVIPCGVDLTQFRPGMKSEKPSILFVGTTGGRKRGAMLAEIFSREIRPRVPDAELWMVTDVPVSGDGVIHMGKVPLEKLLELFRSAWVFCLPSTYEGFGVPYVEAMASGTAVVASPNPGAREVLVESRFGVIAEDGKLGDTLVELLTDEEKRDDLVRRGTDRALEFSWDNITRQYEEVYHQLISRWKPGRARPRAKAGNGNG